MAIRCGYSVGRTTGESSLGDQLKQYKAKPVIAPTGFGKNKSKRTLYAQKEAILQNNTTRETLLEKCIKVVVENFASRPVKEIIPPPQMAEIIKRLPTNLPPVIGAKYIYDESYWKRCSVEKYGWHNCTISEHGLLWKQLYFEKYLQEKLESYDPVTETLEQLYELVDSCMDYIFTLTFRQLPSHMELVELFGMLPNLSKINFKYGVNKIGMNYERMLFGMKISDATSLARIFDKTETITTVILSECLIDDDLLRMLMTGLIKNNTITAIDLSHNKISNHGARLLSKLLGDNSVISMLDLSDNQIHSEGGRYLARGLRENDSLLSLNLRLNRLEDEGCRLLFEGIQDNLTLIDINIGCNGASAQTAQTLFSILRDQEHKIKKLDISGNDFDANQFEMMRLSLGGNKTLTSIDMRNNPGTKDAERAINEIEKIVHNNEINLRRLNNYPI